MPELKYAVAVAERLLASNTFCQEQSLFMGMGTFDGKLTELPMPLIENCLIKLYNVILWLY